jgi:hypothetical protein
MQYKAGQDPSNNHAINQATHDIHDVGYYTHCGPNLSKLRVSCFTFEFLISTSPTVNYLGHPLDRLLSLNTDTPPLPSETSRSSGEPSSISPPPPLSLHWKWSTGKEGTGWWRMDAHSGGDGCTQQRREALSLSPSLSLPLSLSLSLSLCGGGCGMVAATVMVVRCLFFFLEPFSCVGWHPHGKVFPPAPSAPLKVHLGP